VCCKILSFFLFNADVKNVACFNASGYFYFLLFLGQKINSIKRLLALNEELIKELIPQIGLRASFLYSWKRLTSVSAIQGEVLFINSMYLD